MNGLESQGEMEVTAWSNGGPGYGIKIKRKDRDKYFSKFWEFVYLLLEDQEAWIKININNKGFWNKGSELRSVEIRKWLVENHLAPWKKYRPPKLVLETIKENKFYLRKS